MSNFPQSRPYELGYGTDSKVLFSFFNTVYAWMAAGLAVTATVSWLAAQNLALMQAMANRGIMVVLFLGAALIAWGVSSAAGRISVAVATVLFMVYASVIGLAIAPIFHIYKMETIGAAFLMTGGVFGVMSVYGFVTKRDLSSMGSILIMLVVGLFLASLVNIFLASSALSWLITYAVLGVFIGLTAYETQQLRVIALTYAHDSKMAARYAIIGSLNLYISFINMFLSILRILGNRR